jgi:hypothetical protein
MHLNQQRQLIVLNFKLAYQSVKGLITNYSCAPASRAGPGFESRLKEPSWRVETRIIQIPSKGKKSK